jgi:hypothetical protein
MAIWNILQTFGIFYDNLELYMLCSFGTFFPVLVYCAKKNLATLIGSAPPPGYATFGRNQSIKFYYTRKKIVKDFAYMCRGNPAIDFCFRHLPLKINHWTQSYDFDLQRQRCKNASVVKILQRS